MTQQKKAEKLRSQVDELDRKMEGKVQELEKKRGCKCFPFLGAEIKSEKVNEVFEELLTHYHKSGKKLHVIIDSGGGDADAAYNLASLFRKYASDELVFIVPRWAKSAATLLVCAGDRIDMTPIAELGPIDPQITEFNPLERRIERFSPLHISSTLSLLREEFETGSEKLAHGLLQRLQFPLTLGSFVKAQEIGEQYVKKLLVSRMLTGEDDCEEVATEIAEELGGGFADHGYCLKVGEAQSLGLKAIELEGVELKLVWDIYKLYKEKMELNKELETLDLRDDLPQEVIDQLDDILGLKNKRRQTTNETPNGEEEQE